MKNTLACENTKKQKAVSRLEKMLFLQTETLKIFYLTILNNICKQLKRMKTENLNSCVASLVADASSVEKSDARRRRLLESHKNLLVTTMDFPVVTAW